VVRTLLTMMLLVVMMMVMIALAMLACRASHGGFAACLHDDTLFQFASSDLGL
jgi:hypothetical protein